MNKQQQMMQIRKRKLGLLIYDARSSARRTPQECAEAIGVPLEAYLAYEKGDKAPSLPELENLSFYLEVNLEHFWGAESLSARKKPENVEQKEQLRKIRDRVIGASLRFARQKHSLSIQELANYTLIAEDMLTNFELGTCPIPLPDLETLSKALELRIEDLIDQRGPVGKWRSEQIETSQFLELEPSLRQFVIKPVNIPYVRLAMRLSQMSVEKLRQVAESLLEITF